MKGELGAGEQLKLASFLQLSSSHGLLGIHVKL